MKRMIRIVFAGMVALGMTVSADTVDADHRVQWRTDVAEGYYNDNANWMGGLAPSNGYTGCYGYVNIQANDVTLKAPPGGLEDDSGSIFLGRGSTEHTLTIDTRGTFWEKKNVVAINDWWGVPFAIDLNGHHTFNFEGLVSKGVTPSIWRFEDALFKWKTRGNNDEFDLLSGTLTYARALYLGSSAGTVTFRIHPEATLNAVNNAVFQQRGNATTHTWFLGGEHVICGIVLKDLNAGGGATWMHVTNDTSLTANGDISLGSRRAGTAPYAGGSRGILNISEQAHVTCNGTTYLGAGATVTAPNLANQGEMILSQHAVFSSSGGLVYVGHTQCSTGLVTMADDTVLTTRNSCYLGVHSNAYGQITLKGRAQATIGGVLQIAAGDGTFPNFGEVVLEDDASLYVSPINGNWLCLGSHKGAGSVARFTAGGRSRVTASPASSIEMGYGFDADLEFNVADDAVVTFPGGVITNKVPVGGRSVVSLSSNGVLAVRGMYGGDPATGDACMQFAADGGTLKVSGSSAPSGAFICGCASATIGANGFAFDSSGFDVSIDQAFTAAAGASGATFTKAGLGALTVLRDSSHPKTLVSQGALVFGPGVTRFGDALEFAAGAKLEITDAAACVEADSLSFAGSLQVVLPNDYALDAAHPILSISGGLAQSDFEKIIVSNPQAGRAYALELGADGKTVSVTVTVAEGTAKTWTGASGTDWNTAANWDPAGVPTHNDAVTVANAATIAVSAPASVATISAPAAAVSVAGDSPLYVAAGVDVAQGGTLTLGAPVRNADGTVAKTGAGTLVVSGDNATTMQGDWELESGVTEFTSASALGTDSARQAALSVSNGTFRYSGAAAEIERPWRLLGEYPSVFDIAGDLTFKNFKISHLQGDGGFAKLGSGTLTLEMPAGTTTLSWWSSAPRKGNSDINGILALQDGGATGWDGLAQMTVLDGRLAIVGKGKNVTTVKQEHHGGIGGSGVVATSAPELYLKDLTITMGSGSGFHTLIGQQMAAGSAAPRMVLDNANATFNGLNVGHSKANGNADVVRPVLAITNGTLNIAWNMAIPNNVGGIAPIVRVGTNGVLQRASTTAAGGINFYQRIDARFEDGGLLEVRTPQNLTFGDNAYGELVFARGGGMKVHRFLGSQTANTAEIVLDGGFAEFTLNGGISMTASPAKCGIRADAGGGELIVGSGVEHALAVPLRGGHFVKKGAGTLVLTNDLSYSLSNYQPVYAPLGTTTVKVANTGGVEIAEGVLKCVTGTTDANSRFSGTGTLSGEFDAFTLDVEPGATDALTFTDLTVTCVTVDFGKAPGEEVKLRDMPETVIAKVATEAAFRAISWKGANCGDGIVSEFRYDAAAGEVRARFRSSGVVIILR